MEINQLIELLECAAAKVRREKTQVSGEAKKTHSNHRHQKQPIRLRGGVSWEEQMEAEAGRDAFRSIA